jgi:hypothetical protein
MQHRPIKLAAPKFSVTNFFIVVSPEAKDVFGNGGAKT